MKRFLKPTGQLLTTAVFTSAALEPMAAAQSVPQPPTPERENQTDITPSVAHQSVRVDAKTKTIVPPEATSSREFMKGSRSQISSHATEHRFGAHAEIGSSPLRVVQSVTPLSHTQPSLPSSNDLQLEVSSREDLLTPAHGQSFDVRLAQSAPSLPSSDEERHAQNTSQSSASAATRSGTFASADSQTGTPQSQSRSQSSSQEVSQTTSPASTSNPAPSSDPSRPEGTTERVEETRAWLDDTLNQLVERDRADRETLLRENLVNSAHQQLGSRNVSEARRLANNPVLTESERTELMEAIADVEDRRFYPFVSADRAAEAARPQVNEMPSRDWLVAQMDAYADSTNANCVAVSADSSGEDGVSVAAQAQSAAPYSSMDEEFVSGGEFLAGIGHQAPSIYADKSDRSYRQPGMNQPGTGQFGMNQPGMNQIGMNQPESGSAGSSASLPVSANTEAIARAGDCPPTLGQHIGGVTFATLSGYEWMNQAGSQQNLWQMSFPLAVAAPITSRFGWRSHPIYGNRRFHHGVDFGAPTGTPVLAALPGRVQTSGSLSGYGLTIIIENDELQQRNLYAHMSRLAVPVGTWVEQGSVIGWVGSTGNSTGPHLHFEVHHRNGNDWTAVDPLQAAAQMLANRGRRE